ncbi:alcohol dehydrogenase Adh1, partial [Violaceomyces palustris]
MIATPKAPTLANIDKLPPTNYGAYNDDPSKVGVGPLELRDDIPMPKPGPGQVLVNFHYSGLCHSDIEIFYNSWPDFFPPNETQGHEGTGYVAQVGEGVKDLKVGDKVGQKFIAEVCHKCEQCKAGWETYCHDRYHSATSRPGTFQRYAVADASYVAKIPDAVELADAAPILCAGVTVYKAIKHSGVKPGEWLALVGAAGGLGHIGTQVCKALGIRCIGVDGGAEREAFVRELGAEEFVDFTKHSNPEDIAAEVVKKTGGGAHGVVVVAGHASGYVPATKMLRLRGTLVAVGLPPADQGCKIVTDPFELVLRGIKITGSNVGTKVDMEEILQLVAEGKVKPRLKVVNISELPELVKKYRHGGMTT